LEGTTRRSFITGTAAILAGGLYAGQLSFAEAQAKQVPLRHLTPAEASLLGVLGDTLLPGAQAAGIAYFIDQQLSVSPERSMLILKYMDYPDSFPGFYRKGALALDALSRARHQANFAGASAEARNDLVREIARGDPPHWDGPPAPVIGERSSVSLTSDK
jgi:hypothetical protein